MRRLAIHAQRQKMSFHPPHSKAGTLSRPVISPVAMRTPASLQRKLKDKISSINSVPDFELFLQAQGKDHSIFKILTYGGKYESLEIKEHLKLYFYDSDVAASAGRLGYTELKPIYKNNNQLDYKIYTWVAKGQSPDQMLNTLTHEEIHVKHNLALAKSKVATALDFQQGKITSEQREEIIEKSMTEKFGVDVSKKANSEVLAYSHAFAETYQQNKDVALASIESLVMNGFFRDASAEARDIAIQTITGKGWTKAELRELLVGLKTLRKKLITAFGRDLKISQFFKAAIAGIKNKLKNQ
jgi:hypothetical protein